MKYAILKCINGNYSVHAEDITAIENAKTQFHGLCQNLWSAPDVITASVIICDEQFRAVDGYIEYVHHEVAES